MKRKYDILLTKIAFNDLHLPTKQRKYDYSADEKLRPLVYFFKYLARKPEPTVQQQQSNINRLKIWIPDTIVFNDGDLPPMWFYSNEQGYVKRTDTFVSKNIATKLGNYASPDELVALVKSARFNSNNDLVGNEVKLVSTKDLNSAIGGVFSAKGEMNVI